MPRRAACSKWDGIQTCQEEACRGPNLEIKRRVLKEIG